MIMPRHCPRPFDHDTPTNRETGSPSLRRRPEERVPLSPPASPPTPMLDKLDDDDEYTTEDDDVETAEDEGDKFRPKVNRGLFPLPTAVELSHPDSPAPAFTASSSLLTPNLSSLYPPYSPALPPPHSPTDSSPSSPSSSGSANPSSSSLKKTKGDEVYNVSVRRIIFNRSL
jgi:hypothetical protein